MQHTELPPTVIGLTVQVPIDGHMQTVATVANNDGLHTGKPVRKVRRGLLKKTTIYAPDQLIVRWDDVLGYDITAQPQNMFAGSDISTPKAFLVLKTTATQLQLVFKWSDPVRLRNKLGPYLAKVDAHLAA